MALPEWARGQDEYIRSRLEATPLQKKRSSGTQWTLQRPWPSVV